MKMCEASQMDLLALKERVERKEYRPELHQPKDWPGTEERDLWIEVLERKNRSTVFAQENEALFRAVEKAERNLPEFPDREPDLLDYSDEVLENLRWIVIGVIVGVLVSLAGFWMGLYM